MRTNTARKPTVLTHEGAPARHIDAMAQLRRSVCSCFLWEREFYEDGVEIAERVGDLAGKVPLEDLARLAHEVRTVHKLRHMPLLLLAHLAKRGKGNNVVAEIVGETIQRADELGELLAIYARIQGVKPSEIKGAIPAQLKKGLARAFRKFDAYQLAKYNRKTDITLRDVMCLTHPKPQDDEQAAVWKSLLDGNLPAPDTWEVALSGGADKRETFERLLSEGKLGYLALLRNLRNMMEAGVRQDLIEDSLMKRRGADRVLPFRFVAAANAVPQLEPAIDRAMLAGIEQGAELEGLTVYLVDVSGSMDWALSERSDLRRIDAAAALASIVRGRRRIFSFSQKTVEVPPRLGMAGVDAIINSQSHWSTNLGDAIRTVNQIEHDRLIVISDEQSHQRIPDPVAQRAYLINVASAQNGIGYGRFVHIDGFSENVIKFVMEYEAGAGRTQESQMTQSTA